MQYKEQGIVSCSTRHLDNAWYLVGAQIFLSGKTRAKNSTPEFRQGLLEQLSKIQFTYNRMHLFEVCSIQWFSVYLHSCLFPSTQSEILDPSVSAVFPFSLASLTYFLSVWIC